MFYRKETEHKRDRKATQHRHHVLFFPTFNATSCSICSGHRLANSSSVNLLADCLARWRTAYGFGRLRAFSKPRANSASVVAWKPGEVHVSFFFFQTSG